MKLKLLAYAIAIFISSSLVGGLLRVELVAAAAAPQRPNLILVMADDMGWGQTGYYDHPVLKTPHLDAMAANGLRFDRYYAGAPNCSPSRATVLTGRTNDRTGVQDHGYPLRLQEQTVAQALRDAGYATAHFGKWHLNGFSGPGAPILAEDERRPSVFGFDEWLSVTNFFDRNPILSRAGKFEEFTGDSSEIIVDQALTFISQQAQANKPFFAVIWYGSPHDPFMATEQDMQGFADLDPISRAHYGELVAMDRSLGTLRQGLRKLQIEANTLLWFNSDNGGLSKIKPGTVGGLRDYKNSVYEGGLRVPGIIEWPAGIATPRITRYPAGNVDIFPTLAEVAGLPEAVMLQPQDGRSLVPLFQQELSSRPVPLGFRHRGRAAWIDNDLKLVTQNIDSGKFELYNLEQDPGETTDLAATAPESLAKLRRAFEAWNSSVERSVAGKDYPQGRVTDAITERRSWPALDVYEPWIEAWKERPEFKKYLQSR